MALAALGSAAISAIQADSYGYGRISSSSHSMLAILRLIAAFHATAAQPMEERADDG
jgi:hypothetical protein